MTRRIEEVTLPISPGSKILHPEHVLLQLEGVDRRLDVGQLCYLTRDTSRRHRKHHTFAPDSLNPARVKAVRKLITFVSDRSRSGGARPATVFQEAWLVVSFVNWCDRQGLHDVLSDKSATAGAMALYVAEQRELVSQSRLNRNSAANWQRSIIATLQDYFEDQNFGTDIRALSSRRSDTNATQVPDAERQASLLAWADALFHGISALLLEFKPYPLMVTTSRGETLQIVPTPRTRKKGEDALGFDAWDLTTGQMRTQKDLQQRYKAEGSKFPSQKAYRTFRGAYQRLQQANGDARAELRQLHSSIALYSFAALFLAETGINMAQLLDMRWSDELVDSVQSPSVVRQKFREVKYRAGGTQFAFKVSLGFMPKLKTYLALRAHIVQECPIDELFIGLGLDLKPVPLSEQFIAMLYQRLEGLGVALPRITARQWRAAKQDWAVSNHGPVVAAKVMGHSLDTAIRAYSNGTDAAHRSELGAFLASVEKTVLRAGDDPAGSIRSAVGICVDFHHPESITPAPTVEPDCRSSEGCLFCDKYRVHADATDIRKLFSCRYCVRLVANRADSVEQYDSTFGVVLRRLDFLLDELRSRDGALVSSIQEDVEVAGNLDSFWANKLEQLFELGVA